MNNRKLPASARWTVLFYDLFFGPISWDPDSRAYKTKQAHMIGMLEHEHPHKAIPMVYKRPDEGLVSTLCVIRNTSGNRISGFFNLTLEIEIPHKINLWLKKNFDDNKISHQTIENLRIQINKPAEGSVIESSSIHLLLNKLQEVLNTGFSFAPEEKQSSIKNQTHVLLTILRPLLRYTRYFESFDMVDKSFSISCTIPKGSTGSTPSFGK